MITFCLGWPALFAYLYFSKQTRVIISYKGEVLLVKSWLGAGKWVLPGGGLRPGEDTLIGAMREVQEQTVIQLDPKWVKLLGKCRVRDSGLSSRQAIYTVELLDRPAPRKQKFEPLDIKWFAVKNLANNKEVSAASQRLVRAWRELSQPAKMKSV